MSPMLAGILCERTTLANISPGEIYTYASTEDVLLSWARDEFEDILVHMASPTKQADGYNQRGTCHKFVTRIRYITAERKD